MFRPKLPVDGSWTEWSSWSSCLSDCRKNRTRGCNYPSPMFGGADCVGNTIEKSTLLCYGGDCCPGKEMKVVLILFTPTPVKDSSDYIGCFKKETGIYSTGYLNGYMTHCKCVGYCNSHNFSLSAAGYYG